MILQLLLQALWTKKMASCFQRLKGLTLKAKEVDRLRSQRRSNRSAMAADGVFR